MAKQPLSRHSKPTQAATQENQQQPTGQPGHTPGSWYYNKNRRNICTVAKDLDTIVVAKVHCSEHDTYSEEDAERDANGKLMAAAPDLLAACEAAAGELEVAFGPSETVTPIVKALRAAIAKATGKAGGQ